MINIYRMISKEKSQFSINLKNNGFSFKKNSSNDYNGLAADELLNQDSKKKHSKVKDIKNKILKVDMKKLLNII